MVKIDLLLDTAMILQKVPEHHDCKLYESDSILACPFCELPVYRYEGVVVPDDSYFCTQDCEYHGLSLRDRYPNFNWDE